MKKLLAGALLAYAFALPAQAAVTISYTGGAAAANLPTGFTVVQNFDGLAAGTSIGTNAAVFNTSVGGIAARPEFGSTGNFGAVLGEPTDGSYTFNLSRATTAFSFILGSLDTYNSIRIGFADGTFQTLQGGAIKNDLVFDSGNQTIPDTNGRVTYFAGSGPRISSVTFGSTSNSFEFDNLAIGAVPEPATWGMMILGFGLVGAAVRRRRTNLNVTYA